jgi:hypothetical protein
MRESRLRLPLWLAVGYFIMRAPARLARMELPRFLARIAVEPREDADFVRVSRIARRWFRVPGLRAGDTCYLRSLVLFRFVHPGNGDLALHFGIDEPSSAANERLHGHAWVSLNGMPWNPPESFGERRLREIYRFSKLTGGSSTSGATTAVAMMRSSAPAPGHAPPPPALSTIARAGAASVDPIARAVPRTPGR